MTNIVEMEVADWEHGQEEARDHFQTITEDFIKVVENLDLEVFNAGLLTCVVPLPVTPTNREIRNNTSGDSFTSGSSVDELKAMKEFLMAHQEFLNVRVAELVEFLVDNVWGTITSLKAVMNDRWLFKGIERMIVEDPDCKEAVSLYSPIKHRIASLPILHRVRHRWTLLEPPPPQTLVPLGQGIASRLVLCRSLKHKSI